MAVAADFHALRIASLRHDPGDALVVTFDVPAALTATFAFKPGQHIAVRATLDGEEVRRNYSICAGPGDALRVAIKRVSGGRFSVWAHDTLTAGMSLDVMPPAGRFVLADGRDQPRQIVLFAAGSGITPCLGITKQALENETATRVTLVYGNRGRETAMFADELESLKDTHLDRFELIHVLSREGEADVALFSGRIGGDKVRALGQRLIDYGAAERVFVCGPGSMIKDVREALLGLGIAKDRVSHEFFAAGGGAHRVSPSSSGIPRLPSPPPHFDGAHEARREREQTEVIAILDDVRHRLTMAPGETVLAAALRAGLKAPYSCQGGMCATCRGRIVEGQVEMLHNYSLEPWEMERGFVLTCQAVAKSPRVVVDWDAM